MFRPPFPGPRGPRQVSADHTTGCCLSRCRHPLPRRQGQCWARREDLACSQQRPLSSRSQRKTKLCPSPPKFSQSTEMTQSRNQLANVHSLPGLSFKRLGSPSRFQVESLLQSAWRPGRLRKQACQGGAHGSPSAPKTSDCACMFPSRLPEQNAVASQ